MPISKSLLYLLLLYAVLDKSNKLSLTTGLSIAFVILLFTCYYNCCCRRTCRGTRALDADDVNPFVLTNSL